MKPPEPQHPHHSPGCLQSAKYLLVLPSLLAPLNPFVTQQPNCSVCTFFYCEIQHICRKAQKIKIYNSVVCENMNMHAISSPRSRSKSSPRSRSKNIPSSTPKVPLVFSPCHCPTCPAKDNPSPSFKVITSSTPLTVYHLTLNL